MFELAKDGGKTTLLYLAISQIPVPSSVLG